MIAHGLDPSTMPRRPATTPRDYIVPHLYETHDIWHVVTGSDTDVPGELALQGFYAAQSPSKGPIAIITAAMINTLAYKIDQKDARIEAIVRGWLLGKRAKPLFGVRWNELWASPMDELRSQFSIDIESARSACSEKPLEVRWDA
jgi:ubiquinone biosynthesis protein Coq4